MQAESSGTKKRSRDPNQDDDDDDDKKNRGNYRCSRCNLPKKGHVCPFQPRLKRKDLPEGAYVHASVQAELDEEMVVRNLPLDKQGFCESYFAIRTTMQSASSFCAAGGETQGSVAGPLGKDSALADRVGK